MLELATLRLIVPIFLTLAALLGVVGILNPRLFATMASKAATWVDSDRWFALLDKRFDVDSLVLRHTRIFGTLVLASAAVLGFVYSAS